MRARLARMGSKTQTGNPVLEPLFRTVRANHPKADLALLERAYLTAEKWHGTQMRKSGDPYITHPLAVTTILADIGMTEPTLVAALLHDTVEDTPYTLDQLRVDFGDEVAILVDGVTKLEKVKYGDAAQAETIRKMIVAMARDIRVLVIKLADRLHNMRTVRYVKQSTQERQATESLDIYAPLAHRLGMNTIKWELEDLAFATLHPKVYDEIVRMVADRAPSRDQFLAEVVNQVESDLKDAKVKATVTGRPKHYYSIYQKMILGGREFTDIYDLVGLRVLVDEDRDCYSVLGVLHSRWNPVLGRFKDYVAMPKFNMYQSLHTTVIGPQGKPVEIQIRTRAMHRRAEYGVAAHWKYKEDGRKGVDTDQRGDMDDMSWVRQLLDWQSEVEDPGSSWSRCGSRSTGPRSTSSPRAATSSRCPGRDAGRLRVRRAHRGRPPHHRRAGQRPPGAAGVDAGELRRRRDLHLQGRRTPGPRRTGCGFVKSPRARSKIRQWFTKERREEAIERGKEQIAKLMRKEGVPAQAGAVPRVADRRPRSTSSSPTCRRSTPRSGRATSAPRPSYAASSSSTAATRGPSEDLSEGVTITGRRVPLQGRQPGGDAGVIVKGASDVWVKLAKCCTPVPPDAILGFVTKGGGVSVHRLRLHQRRRRSRPSRRSCSTSSGPRPPSRRSWSTSRSRPSTGPACSPTSPWSSRTPT